MDKYLREPPVYNVVSPTNESSLLSANAILDSNNDKILKGTFTVVRTKQITILSHHDLVTPAYFVEIEQNRDLCGIVRDVLYKKFNVSKLKKSIVSTAS